MSLKGFSGYAKHCYKEKIYTFNLQSTRSNTGCHNASVQKANVYDQLLYIVCTDSEVLHTVVPMKALRRL